MNIRRSDHPNPITNAFSSNCSHVSFTRARNTRRVCDQEWRDFNLKQTTWHRASRSRNRSPSGVLHVLHGHFHSYTCDYSRGIGERERRTEILEETNSPSIIPRLIPSMNFPPRVWRGTSLNRNDVNRSDRDYIFVPINDVVYWIRNRVVK